MSSILDCCDDGLLLKMLLTSVVVVVVAAADLRLPRQPLERRQIERRPPVAVVAGFVDVAPPPPPLRQPQRLPLQRPRYLDGYCDGHDDYSNDLYYLNCDSGYSNDGCRCDED